MSHIMVKRLFDPGIDRATITQMLKDNGSCMQIYQIQWHESFLANDGKTMICRFDAPDTEAVRAAMRTLKMTVAAVWPSTRHDGDLPGNGNIMVERQFEQATTVDAMQAIEDKGSQCLKIRNVTFIRTYFSSDQKNMLCLYQAPDAESVRQAQSHAGMPFEQVWTFDYVTPESI